MAWRMSGMRLATPVEVSLWTTITAFTAPWRSSRSFVSTTPASTPRRQSPGTKSTDKPRRSAIFFHSVAKWPVSNMSTLSPGLSVLTMAASHAPVPEDGKTITGPLVPKTGPRPSAISAVRRANCGPR